MEPLNRSTITGNKCPMQSANLICSGWQILVIKPANPLSSGWQIPVLRLTIPRLQEFVKRSTGICWRSYQNSPVGLQGFLPTGANRIWQLDWTFIAENHVCFQWSQQNQKNQVRDNSSKSQSLNPEQVHFNVAIPFKV